MTAEATAAALPRRRGRKPTLSREDVLGAAVALVDEGGFSTLSLRAVARRLDVSPMNLYTYVTDAEELERLVIERLVAARTQQVSWPSDWRDCLRRFAFELAALVSEHPALLDAYARGAVSTRTALEVAEQLLTRLEEAGLSADEALTAYESVHALVLGHVLLGRSAPRHVTTAVDDLPRVARLVASGKRLGGEALERDVELLLNGLGTAD